MKRFVKKAVSLLLVSGMALSMAACGGSSSSSSASGSASGASSEKKVTLNMSHTQAPNSVSDLTAQEFAKLVSEKSNGSVEVKVYTNCGLSGGDLTKAIEMVQTGDIDIHSCAPANIANFDKRFYVFWLPYLFNTEEDLINKCGSEEFKTAINGWCNSLNMTMLGINNAGSRQISNSKKEITTPEDLQGLNIRVPGANVFIDLYKDYFHANPTAMDFSEVYTALQQGTIDAQENPISVFASSKLNEVQQYVTLWDGVRDTTIWVMNTNKLNSLSDNQKKAVEEAAAEALQWGNDYLAENESDIIAQLKEGGTTITELTDEQKQAFKDASAGIYDKYADELGQDVIDLFK